jgi:hypothetical protein
LEIPFLVRGEVQKPGPKSHAEVRVVNVEHLAMSHSGTSGAAGQVVEPALASETGAGGGCAARREVLAVADALEGILELGRGRHTTPAVARRGDLDPDDPATSISSSLDTTTTTTTRGVAGSGRGGSVLVVLRERDGLDDRDGIIIRS